MKHRPQRQVWSQTQSAVATALLFFILAGCVRVPLNKDAIRTQLISATANDLTILNWSSRTDMIYTVMVSDRFTSAQWQPLPEGTNLRGTGDTMELRIKEDPNHPRTYKLQAVPLRPVGRSP